MDERSEMAVVRTAAFARLHSVGHLSRTDTFFNCGKCEAKMKIANKSETCRLQSTSIIPCFQRKGEDPSTRRATRSTASSVMYSNYLASAEEADGETTVWNLGFEQNNYYNRRLQKICVAFNLVFIIQGTAPTGQCWTSDLLESAQKYKSKMGKTQTSLSAVRTTSIIIAIFCKH